MKKESLILNIYPLNKNSLILVNFDELGFPHNIHFGSIKVVDNNNKRLLFDLVYRKDYNKKSKYFGDINKNHLAVIIDRNNVKHIKILYNLSNKSGKYTSPKKNIGIIDNFYFTINTENVSVLFEKKGYSIEKIKIKDHEYGPLQLVTSRGNLFFQKYMKNAKFSIVSDSNIIKIIKISGVMKVEGSECRQQGYLPVDMTYYFWSPEGKNMMSKAEFELKYDEATGLDGNKIEFLDPLVWYRLDNSSKKLQLNGFFSNSMNGSKIITLEHPYYAGFKDGNSTFAMFPYLALPNDGIHIEQGRDFFGACWHSMSSPKVPYWAQIDKKEYTGKPQGYYPAHSLKGYWNIGLYFGDAGDIEEMASAFSYQPKIRNVIHIGSEPVSNACMARWKDNKRMAFNAITDDAKINDYLYRAKGKMPKWVQIAIATRTLFGINYHRFCYIGNKIFYLPKQKLLSTILSTLFCIIGIGKPLRKKFEQENLSYMLHTNTHPKIFRLNAKRITNEIQKSESTWIEWGNKISLSHNFSYTSPYGLATEKGTMEKAAFSASKCLQWIREWPIPNAPLDFFLPTRLFWGICTGEIFDKENCSKIKEEFIKRYRDGCDYMLIAGHVPEQVECPDYVTEIFGFLQKNEDVWFASSDEIIKYYKSRENIIISSVKKHGNKFLMELENKLPHYFATEVTLMQHISKKINKIQFTADNKNYSDAEYKFIGKNVVMYDIPSNAKRVVIS